MIDCNDGPSAADLATTGRFLVHILESRPAVVDTIRAKLHDQDVYGLASAEPLSADGKLPYTENLVNAVLLGDGTSPRVPLAEVMRVLCPGGMLLAADKRLDENTLAAAGFEKVRRLDGPWRCACKPWPKAMDWWSHPRHAADGNTVSHDTLIGPPRRVRWVTGPQQEISDMVTAGGRSFFAGVLARDAFNGLRLWEQNLKPSPARGGFGFAMQRGSVRPIATDKGLLVVHNQKLQTLDAATGALLREYPQAGIPTEILLQTETILAIDKATIRALDLESGRLRWKQAAAEARCVVAGDGAVFYLEGERRPAKPTATVQQRAAGVPPVPGRSTGETPAVPISGQSLAGPSRVPSPIRTSPITNEPLRLKCCDLANGELRWQQTGFAWMAKVRGCVYHDGLLVCEVSTLADMKEGNSIHVLSVLDGSPLWSRDYIPGASHMKQARAMFTASLLWVLEDKLAVGLDPRSGQVKRTVPASNTHCFPPVASTRYLFAGELDLSDLETGKIDANPITKAACSRDAGIVPANGLLYTFPKHCICWPMLRDYAALAPARPGGMPRFEDLKFAAESGPARPPQIGPEAPTNQWPCYRHDALRSGSTAGPLPRRPAILWTVALGNRPKGVIADDWRGNYFIRGPIGPPVVANGFVFVTRPDAHQVVALDARNGTIRWTFTADGRVDTAPTIHRGLCLFGSKSGHVYCLRADCGAVVWRLRAAPLDERIVAYGQIESPWPVPGSVLVVDDVAYFAAGRQPLADGGILVFAVDPSSGRVRWVQRLNQVPQKNFYNSSGLEFDNFDLLQAEGEAVAMSRWLFDRATGRMTCREKSGFALMAGGVMFPRGSWSYAPRNESESWKERPFLRPLAVFRDKTLYGCSQDRQTVFRRDFQLGAEEKFDSNWFAGWATVSGARKGGDLWRTQRIARGAAWSVVPLPSSPAKQPVSAMILAGDALYVAGAQGRLSVLDTKNGNVEGQLDVPPPVWDGLAAADGHLFLSTDDGRVVCLGQR
jgi:outer membrane protein assembly factor BamB